VPWNSGAVEGWKNVSSKTPYFTGVKNSCGSLAIESKKRWRVNEINYFQILIPFQYDIDAPRQVLIRQEESGRPVKG
jgi:hypothetical protein